jgi:hypothetical protein
VREHGWRILIPIWGFGGKKCNNKRRAYACRAVGARFYPQGGDRGGRRSGDSETQCVDLCRALAGGMSAARDTLVGVEYACIRGRALEDAYAWPL